MSFTPTTILNHFPRLKAVLRTVLGRPEPESAVSSQYVALQVDTAESEGQRLRAAWQDNELPNRQWSLVQGQLQRYRLGTAIDVFDVLVDALRKLPSRSDGMTVVEVGCSSGYYSEVLEIAGLSLKYSGCDYSQAFIQMAREKYPAIEFSVEDATSLHYPDNSFDIVVSGGCLLHIPEYALAVAETARVARRYAIFHRTPVVWGQQEQWYSKQAYGIETVEIHFNETEFLALIEKNGFELLDTKTLYEENVSPDRAQGSAMRSYVCRKRD